MCLVAKHCTKKNAKTGEFWRERDTAEKTLGFPKKYFIQKI